MSVDLLNYLSVNENIKNLGLFYIIAGIILIFVNPLQAFGAMFFGAFFVY